MFVVKSNVIKKKVWGMDLSITRAVEVRWRKGAALVTHGRVDAADVVVVAEARVRDTRVPVVFHLHGQVARVRVRYWRVARDDCNREHMLLDRSCRYITEVVLNCM